LELEALVEAQKSSDFMMRTIGNIALLILTFVLAANEAVGQETGRVREDELISLVATDLGTTAGMITGVSSVRDGAFWVSLAPVIRKGRLCLSILLYGELTENGPVVNVPEFFERTRYRYYLLDESDSRSDSHDRAQCESSHDEDYFEVTSPIEEGTLLELTIFLQSDDFNRLVSSSRELSLSECAGISDWMIYEVGLPNFGSLREQISYIVQLRSRRRAQCAAAVHIERTRGQYVTGSIGLVFR
jgi:hypothetical protein